MSIGLEFGLFLIGAISIWGGVKIRVRNVLCNLGLAGGNK